MKKSINILSIFLLLLNLFSYSIVYGAAQVEINAEVLPADAQNLTATQVAPGVGEAVITWTTSSNISAPTGYQRIEITGPQGPSINFTSQDLLAFPGPGIGDNYATYNGGLNLINLTIGETYIIRIVSIAGTLESLGAAPEAQIIFTPAPGNPPPVLLSEDNVTPGTENTLYWTNGGIDDPLLECKLTASYDDFNTDPSALVVHDSGWVPCPDSAITYDHTFTGLISGVTYYYQVQTQHPVDGLSPYSNVESSQQAPLVVGGGGGGGSSTVCGNAVIESGEDCDDGNKVSGDGCSRYCKDEPAVCGNNFVETGETCDDGNLIDGDGCSTICLAEAPIACGNNLLEAGEACDDGNLINGDGCSNICTLEAPEICGDGIVQAPEQCDDGNYANGDGCSFICEVEHAAAPEAEVCGNGIVVAPETCDDGNILDGDGCSAICELEILPVCGNAIIETLEECDDGNLLNLDGCDEFCVEEETVEVYLHVTGAPQHRTTTYYDNLPDSEILTTDEFSLSAVGATNISRIHDTPNRGLISELLLYKPSVGSLDSINTPLDNFGKGWVAVTVIPGTYSFALNGESHNNRVLANFLIDASMDGETIELDFTKAGTQYSIAGDVIDNNFINAFDMASMLNSYKVTGIDKHDLNKDEDPIVNAIDLAVVLWNYKKTGEKWQSVAL